MYQSTAIIVFARTAEAEAREKHLFLHNGRVNKKLLQVLREHTLRTVRRTELPYYIFSEEEQIGESFAVKITNAYSKVFAMGYKNVIGIGADVPCVTSKEILKAATLLDENKVVCGPTQCGGSYLLGINNLLFNPETFLNLAWQTNNLFEDVANKFKDIYILDELQELNDASQLLQFTVAKNRLNGIAVQLLKIIQSFLHNIRRFGNAASSIKSYSSLQLLARAP